MAKKSKTELASKQSGEFSDLSASLGSDLEAADNAVSTIRQTWDARERLLIAKNSDALSKDFVSRVSDSQLATIIMERAARVMAQEPSGQVVALTKQNQGKGKLMDLVIRNYVIPNDNSQFPHLIKMRLWDMYSLIYGVQPLMYDYTVANSYIGPKSTLIPIRNWFPQPGKLSAADCDWMMVATDHNLGWLNSQKNKKDGGWISDAIDRVYEKAKKGSRSASKNKLTWRTSIEKDREGGSGLSSGKGDFATITLVTKYEAGDDGYWITFAPDFDNEVVRKIKNPHGNGEIPIILKYCSPLLESIYGVSDMERGMSLQNARDSVTNLFLDGIKLRLFPPRVVNPDGMMLSSLRWEPGATWFENVPNSIREFRSDPETVNNFQSIMAQLTGMMQSQNGTTDTTVSKNASVDPTFGRTPEALKMLDARESTRDNQDRALMEIAIETLYKRWINLISQKMEKPIMFHLFGEEVQQIAEENPDVMTLFEDNMTAKVTLSKKNIGGTKYDYRIDSGSTMKQEQAQTAAKLKEILTQVPAIQQMLMLEAQTDPSKPKQTIDVGELFKQILINEGLEADKILQEDSPEDIQAQQQQEMAMQAQIPDATQHPDVAAVENYIQSNAIEAPPIQYDPAIQALAQTVNQGGMNG